MSNCKQKAASARKDERGSLVKTYENVTEEGRRGEVVSSGIYLGEGDLPPGHCEEERW